MYGGLVASLIDCHSIWTAIAWTYREEEREHGSLPAISYVTGSLTVRYLRPTDLDKPALMRAHVTELYPKKALVSCSFFSGDGQTAEGSVVAVRFSMDKSLGAGEGHHREA
jgi:acyl-coenzyme A thioesterase PaaI-like protein